jgi:WD40 repeat protein
MWRPAKELHRLRGHGSEVHCVAFSADGNILASGGGDKLVRVWDVSTGKELRRFPEAVQILKTLAQGLPEARQTQEASHSLQRLAKRAPSAP